MSWLRILLPAAVLAAAAACSFTGGNAPITHGPTTTTVYTVKQGDTLYAIARRYALDPMALARENNLTNPSDLRVGQQLRLSIASGLASDMQRIQNQTTAATARTGAVSAAASQTAATASSVATAGALKSNASTNAGAVSADATPFRWPAQGRIIENFGPVNKGIDIAGTAGDPVRAAADGDVVFVGTVKGYGNLIIVRHKGSDVTAYGHNAKILVKQGQPVTRGQQIAQMGKTDDKGPRVHFEIRRNGKALDPITLLPKQ